MITQNLNHFSPEQVPTVASGNNLALLQSEPQDTTYWIEAQAEAEDSMLENNTKIITVTVLFEVRWAFTDMNPKL